MTTRTLPVTSRYFGADTCNPATARSATAEAVLRRREAIPQPVLDSSLRSLTRAAAELSSYCEHVEHNERTSIDDLLHAANSLCALAVELSSRIEVSLVAAYAERIRGVEQHSMLRLALLAENKDLRLGADILATAETWHELQIGQLVHDRQFHPDVFGLSKLDQFRHYSYHVAKLAGLLAAAIDKDDWEAFGVTRLADIAIFGVKIATVCNSPLPHEPIVTGG